MVESGGNAPDEIERKHLTAGELAVGTRLACRAEIDKSLFARAYHRILKLSRTIANLAGKEEIKSTHLAEALQYRPKGMMI